MFLSAWCLKTELSERMLDLQNVDVNVIEIAQFLECEQFIDTTTELRHPVKFAINNAKQVSFPEDVFHYSMIATYLNKKNIHTIDENGSGNS